MLHNSLEHLMKDVGSDGNIDVHKRKGLPERMKHGLESGFVTSGVEYMTIVIGQKIYIDCFIEVPGRKVVVFSKLITGSLTLWTAAVVSARHERLFRVVTNKRGKDRVASAPDPIAA